MNSKIVKELKLKDSPIALLLTNEKPRLALQFKEGAFGGCVAAMMVAAAKGKTVVFDRKTFSCPGGGTGLGFGNQFCKQFPIECLLSTGNIEIATKMGTDSSMAKGERFYKTPDLAGKFVDSLPITDVPTDYVVFKPLEKVADDETPKLVIFFVNADQLSALVTLADYNRGANGSVAAPFGAACHSIIFGYKEDEEENPRGIIGFFDISQRKRIDRETLSFTVPYKMFQEMEDNVEGSFLEMDMWKKLQERQ